MTAADPDAQAIPLPQLPSGTIGFDRQLVRRTIVLVVLLCWPLLLFGRPAYFPDTIPYYKGGSAAMQYLQGRLLPMPRATTIPMRPPPPDEREQGATANSDVRGARSIPYSLTAFVLRGPGAAMIPLVILQAFMVAFCVAVYLAGLNLADRAWWAVILLLVFATPAAWFTSYAMPDIFAAVTIIGIATMVVFADRLTRPVAIVLALTGGFAISAHASHVALAILLLPLALSWRIWGRRRDRDSARNRRLLWMAAPVLLGLAVVVISGIVGFGEVSLAPKRFPLTLARAIADGPTRWYLEKHCRERHYAVCELYPHGFPQTGGEFLWGPNGIRLRATAAQMERIRAEEPEILLASAAAYPSRQVTDLIAGIGTQLLAFDVDEASFNLRAVAGPDGSMVLKQDPRMPVAAIAWADRIGRISAVATTVALFIGLIGGRGRMRALALLLLAGVIANAAICAIFSGSDDRYQARVIWLLPLAALAAWTPNRRCNIVLAVGNSGAPDTAPAS